MPFVVDYRFPLGRGDYLGTHPGGRFGHIPAQLGPLTQEKNDTQSSNFHALAEPVP